MEGNTIKTYPYGYWKLVIREIKRVKQIHSLSSYCPFFPVISYFRSLISLFSSKFRNLLTFLYLVLADNFGICPQYFSHFVKYFQYQNLFTNRCKNAINKKKNPPIEYQQGFGFVAMLPLLTIHGSIRYTRQMNISILQILCFALE